MLQKIERTINKYNMLSKGEKVIVAVSGGMDSVALLHALLQLREKYSLELYIAHLNHLLRGADAQSDEKFVISLAKEYNLLARTKKVDVAAKALSGNLSFEEAGRIARYDFFAEYANEVGASAVAVGHHADDQVETFFLRLFQGSGIDGLRGIKPKREDGIIRPLLDVTRQEIKDYCTKNNLLWREDYTNAQVDYKRNRVRLNLLPMLESEFNPNIREMVVRLLDSLNADSEYLNEAAEKAATLVIAPLGNGHIAIDLPGFLALELAMQRRVIRLALKRILVNGLRNVSFQHIEEIRLLARQGITGSGLDLPGNIRVEKGYGKLCISFAREDVKAENSFFCCQVKIPGTTKIPELALKVDTFIEEKGSEKLKYPHHATLTAYFDLDKLGDKLFVRNRKPGDVFRPRGLGGKKKIKEYFIDLKIPKADREKIPIFETNEQIIWVGGYRLGSGAEVDERTERVLRVTLEKI